MAQRRVRLRQVRRGSRQDDSAAVRVARLHRHAGREGHADRRPRPRQGARPADGERRAAVQDRRLRGQRRQGLLERRHRAATTRSPTKGKGVTQTVKVTRRPRAAEGRKERLQRGRVGRRRRARCRRRTRTRATSTRAFARSSSDARSARIPCRRSICAGRSTSERRRSSIASTSSATTSPPRPAFATRSFMLPGDVFNRERLIQSYRSIANLGLLRAGHAAAGHEPGERAGRHRPDLPRQGKAHRQRQLRRVGRAGHRRRRLPRLRPAEPVRRVQARIAAVAVRPVHPRLQPELHRSAHPTVERLRDDLALQPAFAFHHPRHRSVEHERRSAAVRLPAAELAPGRASS